MQMSVKIQMIIEAVVQRCSVKKGVLKGFAKFTGKHLCQSPFFNKVAGLQACNFILKNEHRTPLVAAAFVISSKWTA